MNPGFEQLYIAARKKEGRLYTPEQVRMLPFIERSHPHVKEWELRRQSAKRFTDYIWHNGDGLLFILEIGCGNGWFCNYLVKNTQQSYVTGQDINTIELELAERAFDDYKLTWTSEDVFSLDKESDRKWDYIVLNSSIHYFPNLEKLISHLFKLLKKDGEIHIMDSPFYHTMDEQQAAHQRTANYYRELGYPELAKFYTPHLFSGLDDFNPTVLYDPQSLWNRFQKMLGRKKSPFAWIRIKKS